MPLTVVADADGKTIQFHANTTYEPFVGGLAPLQTEGTLGFNSHRWRAS
ncbi:MAG TPA: hypothetical protein VN833_08010 [Candidatus Acidoferrales bacterium]|nr:hypothetical protein [Candidatus Acidoferrales bacterium]